MVAVAVYLIDLEHNRGIRRLRYVFLSGTNELRVKHLWESRQFHIELWVERLMPRHVITSGAD
jgi:hypothetical protein